MNILATLGTEANIGQDLERRNQMDEPNFLEWANRVCAVPYVGKIDMAAALKQAYQEGFRAGKGELMGWVDTANFFKAKAIEAESGNNK